MFQQIFMTWQGIRDKFLILFAVIVVTTSIHLLVSNSAFRTIASSKVNGAKWDVLLQTAAKPIFTLDAGRAVAAKKVILTRNLFNSEGILAPEEIMGEKTKHLENVDFAKLPCTFETIPAEVMGTIYSNNPLKSVVAIKDPKAADADSYHVGEVLIDHEEYEVFAIEHGRVEFRRGDDKICVAFDKGAAGQQGTKALENGSVKTAQVEVVSLDQQYVNDQIGPGFANILSSHKLIPEVQGGKPVGFKMIAIQPGSILDRLKFQSNDVLTDVNSVSMTDPSQGFKLYQALQEEREISVKFLRNGELHITKVLIK